MTFRQRGNPDPTPAPIRERSPFKLHNAERPSRRRVQPQITEPIVLTAATLVGDQLYEREGEPLGEIKDVAFDLQQGCIAYLIVSVGGLLGIGSKFFAVPWSAVYFGDDELLGIDMNAGQLSAAPSFPKDSWPDMSDRQWGAEVHAYFGCTPYWE